MPSQKQIEANRLNALKSTGPRTSEGKARSSMNALKSGIDARSHIIQDESQADLEALTAEYHHRFHPATPEQRMLVDTLVDSEWLLRRFRRVEAQLWQQGLPSVKLGIYDISLAQCYRGTCDEFSRLQRRIDMTQRNYRSALHQLQRLQAAEEAPLDPDPDPVTPRPQTTKPPNGFVPPTPPDAPIDPPLPAPRTLLNAGRDIPR